jgi:glycosyltransferase involved in cell wall biosynthesis
VWALHESFDLDVWWLGTHGPQRRHSYVRDRARFALGNASALVFAAEATSAMYAAFAPAERRIVVPYGIDVPGIDASRRSLDPVAARTERGIPEDAVVVLGLGVFQERKAQVPLVQAFAEIADGHPAARLVLVGANHMPYSRGLRRFVENVGLSSRCTIVPSTSDPYAWHALADLFVLTSDVESSPIAMLEAMAFETPVLASRVFGIPDVVEHGETGYLCEPNDVGELARSLDAALRTPGDERRAVGLAGALRVRERHDPVRYSEKLRSLLRDLAAQPAPAVAD